MAIILITILTAACVGILVFEWWRDAALRNKLLAAEAQALDLQRTIARLRSENQRLTKRFDLIDKDAAMTRAELRALRGDANEVQVRLQQALRYLIKHEED